MQNDADALLSAPLSTLMARASTLAQTGHGRRISYSRKVFVPLTRLCRDVCGYCTFATTPAHLKRHGQSVYLSSEEVLALARQGEAAGCHELLFTLGDRPELRYAHAREALAALGYKTTIDYLHAMCRMVITKTRLLPHVNAGIMDEGELTRLREVSVSQGLMLESTAERLCEPGGVHHGSPDKHPAVRLAMLETAGRLSIPFTTGILIGIGETRDERLDALRAIRDVHERHGHIQEVIVQNFRAKPNTRMNKAAEPDLEDLLWTIAQARLILGAGMNIQAPPNLSPKVFPCLLEAGLNDWGGISPVTPDHVNPEAPWPAIDELARATAEYGFQLVARLAAYPAYCLDAARWMSAPMASASMLASDAEGLARTDHWMPGSGRPIPASELPAGVPLAPSGTTSVAPWVMRAASRELGVLIDAAGRGDRLDEAAIVKLFAVRADHYQAVCSGANALRADVVGDAVGYVVNRNLNYTNLCVYRCGFCAFSKGQGRADLRGTPYDLADAEIARRITEAWTRGAIEVCMQGGIHPGYTGQKYLDLARLVKATQPGIHLHAFSPLEVMHGAQTLGLSVVDFLHELKRAGLDTLPGTAAEILDDEVRAIICPDKLDTGQWLEVMRQAHRLGLRSTATIMFGHVDRPAHSARHLLRIRDLQAESEPGSGFTEFVPLPFIGMEAPLARRGLTRLGPSFRETMLMHAVARLVLHPLITNIQASWVKLGSDGAAHALRAGANDLGGTLMNESISHAAGACFGEEMIPARMDELIVGAQRTPRPRTTLYGAAPPGQMARARAAVQTLPIVFTPVDKTRYLNKQVGLAHAPAGGTPGNMQ